MVCPEKSPKPKITRKTWLFPVIGLAAFFLYIYFFQVDIISVIATAQTADPVLYGFAVALSLIEVFFFSVSWRVLARFLMIKMSIMKAYLLVWYSVFVDTLIPAESVSGEAIRVYMISREQGKEACGRAVASLVAHRILGMAMNVAVLILGVTLFFTEVQIDSLIFNLVLFLSIGITVTLLVLMLFSFKEKWSLKVINWLIRAGKFISRGRWQGKLTKIKEDAVNIAKSFHDSMKEFKNNPQSLVISLFYLAVMWGFSVSVPYIVFLSLGQQVSWGVILITSTIVLAVKSIPLGIPFEVGIPEITMTTLYTLLLEPTLGQNAAGISATATILTRLITLWLRFFIGFAAQQWLELKTVTTPAENISTEKA